MANIILITGGARSGKSSYAEAVAKKFSGSRLYIATAPVFDAEMAQRVERHQQQRKNDGWDTIEEELQLSTVIAAADHYDTILVDCLTLWINNLLYAAEREKYSISEDDIAEKCRELEQVCHKFNGHIIFVINEVGLGIVPDNPLARCFRDLSGRCAQNIAKFADQVVLVACGIPLVLKGEKE